jgi:uncharacterized protein YbaA (DUF1428 family)
MKYVDGFVMPILKKNLPAYRRMARMGGELWKKHGALEYRECVAEDLRAPWALPFPRLLKLKRGETVVFSWIVFRSRAHRDRVNAKVMKEAQAAMEGSAMPFDMKRMAYGGFETIVDM